MSLCTYQMSMQGLFSMFQHSIMYVCYIEDTEPERRAGPITATSVLTQGSQVNKQPIGPLPHVALCLY